MPKYDLEGRTAPDLLNPDDISVVGPGRDQARAAFAAEARASSIASSASG
jgi:hypothetical protein